MAIPLIIHGSLSVKLIKDISFNRNVRAQCNEEDAILWQKNTYASRIELLDLHIRFVTHINSTNKRNAKRSCIVIEHFITRSIRKITFQKEKKKERLYRSAGKCEIKKYNARSKHADHQTLIVMKCVYDAFDDEKDTDTDTHRWRHHRPILLHTIANESFVRNSVGLFGKSEIFMCRFFSALQHLLSISWYIFFPLSSLRPNRSLWAI